MCCVQTRISPYGVHELEVFEPLLVPHLNAVTRPARGQTLKDTLILFSDAKQLLLSFF